MGKGGSDYRLAKQNVGEADFAFIFLVPQVFVGFGRSNGVLVIDNDHAAIDMRDGIAGFELREDTVEQRDVR